MRVRAWRRAATLVTGGVACLVVAGRASAQAPVAPGGAGARPALEVGVSRPLMGENYDLVSGLLEAGVRVPRWTGGGWIVQAGLAYSTAGRTRSLTLANPAVGAWAHVKGAPFELLVSLPLGRELGDDDFATDMALLSDLAHRERYLPGRWGVSLAFAPHVTFRDGSVGDLRVGAIALAAHRGSDADVRARYEAALGLGFSRAVQAGGRLAGTVRLTGGGGFDQRTQQDLALFLRLVHVPGRPELSFRLPIDIDLQDYVTGVAGLRMTF